MSCINIPLAIFSFSSGCEKSWIIIFCMQYHSSNSYCKSMKKVLSYLLFALTTFIGLSFCLSKVTLADVGVSPGPGGIIETGEKNDQIEMTSEKVLVDITKGESEYDELRYEAHVTATFEMTNTTSKDVTLDLVFPIPSWSDATMYEEYDNSTKNIEVYINDQKVETTYQDYEFNTAGLSTSTGVDFTATFAANKTTDIKVEYDTFTPFEPKSIYCSFSYVLETGSHWKGSIGSGEIIIQYPNGITDSIFKGYNEDFKVEEDRLVWNFQNLEPKGEDNIYISYSPALLEIWNKRDSAIANIDSSPNVIFPYVDNMPETYFFGLGYGREGNAVFLLDSLDENLDDGWFAYIEKGETPFVKYDFDAVYKMNSINIIPGIEMLGQVEGTTNQKTFYDIFSRPKKVKLTFSDGSVALVNVTDSKAEVQELIFDEVETSSVTVEIAERYPNFDNKDEYLGIARMQPVTLEKVRELDEEDTEEEVVVTDTDTTEETGKGFLSNYGILIAIGIAGFAIVGGGAFAFVKVKASSKKVTGLSKTMPNTPGSEGAESQQARDVSDTAEIT